MVAVELQSEANNLDASVYAILDEWGVYGARRTELKRMVMAIQQGIAKHDRDKRDGATDPEVDED